jgi:hypothetical protein
MQPQMTDKVRWIAIDGRNGRMWFPEDWKPSEACKQYGDDDVSAVSVEWGYGVRLSAPGYMDCTEWEVFYSLPAARARFDELVAECAEDDAEDDAEVGR